VRGPGRRAGDLIGPDRAARYRLFWPAGVPRIGALNEAHGPDRMTEGTCRSLPGRNATMVRPTSPAAPESRSRWIPIPL
jgi:hypothetical protein